MNISKHFTLEQLTFSATALRHGIEEQNDPPEAVVKNLTYLSETVLEELLKRFPKMKINSGYRSPELNEIVKGSPKSFHLFGCAADLHFGSKEQNEKAFNYIKGNMLFTELINEYQYSWVHVAIVKGREKEKRIKKIG